MKIKNIFCASMDDLKSKHFLITGGSLGIGKEIAKEAARLGANVTIVARRENQLKEARDDIKSVCKDKDQKVDIISADLSDSSKANEVIETAEKASPVDYIVFSQGFVRPGNFTDEPLENFQKSMEVNYMACIYLLKALLPKMKERRSGHVVFIGSAVSHFSFSGYSLYSPTKFAVLGLAETLLNELSVYNINVSIGCPDDTLTPGYENEMKIKPKACALISKKLGTPGSAEKVAKGFIKGIRKRYFHLFHNFDIFMLISYCGGFTPRPRPLLSSLLIPFIHIYSIWISFMLPRWAKKASD